jgi:hypothetical protein
MLVLPDEGNVKIKLTPMERTLYILFLRYPEGINADELWRYWDELCDIYGSQTFTMTRISSRMQWKESATKRRSPGIPTSQESRGRFPRNLARELPSSISSEEELMDCIELMHKKLDLAN